MVARLTLIAAGFYTLAITTLSLVQLGKISLGSFNPTDKMMHAGAYLGLVVVWKFHFLIKEENFKSYNSNLLKISAFSIGFGMLIEVLQGALTNYRQPDWFDIIANTVGVVLAVFLFLLLKSKFQTLKEKNNLIFWKK